MLGLILGVRQPPALAGQPILGESALTFSHVPGPMLQIVGLCGGSGVSTLVWLIGAVAASRSSVPVLICDTGGPTAGLSLYAGVESFRSLSDQSQLLAQGQALGGGLFACGEHGLRVIATSPQFTAEADELSLGMLLSDARAAHGLSVVDGGTLSRCGDRVALSYATHVAWMLPATESGLRRAGRALERIAPLSRPELVIARTEPGAREAAVDELADLADRRDAPLLVISHIQDAASLSLSELATRSGTAIEAIGALLRR